MLAVNRLVAGYGRLPISTARDFDLQAGQAAVLVGPSGSGKTTFLLALAGLADILSGTARLDGVDLSGLSQRERDAHRGRNIGFIFQDLYLVPGLTTVQNLLLAPFACGVDQDALRAEQLLKTLGLGHLAARPAERLSRGEAQRAAVARAMLMRPQLIIADEPTASLDDEACEATLDLLRAAAIESDAALLIASHDTRVKLAIPRHVGVEPVR